MEFGSPGACVCACRPPVALPAGSPRELEGAPGGHLGVWGLGLLMLLGAENEEIYHVTKFPPHREGVVGAPMET